MTASRITTVVKAATSRLLTTRDLFKSQINKTETDSDTYLDWMLKAASAAVEQYCGRVFAQEDVIDGFRLSDFVASTSGGPLILSRRPVVSVAAVVDSSAATTTLSSSMTNVQTTLPCAGALPTNYPFNVLLDAGSKAETVTVVSLASGTTYNVTRAVNGTAVAHASGASVSVSVDSTLIEIDAATGFLTRLDSGAPMTWASGAVSVAYTGGYILPIDPVNRNLPYDIEDATLRVMKFMWFTRSRDPALRSIGEPGLANQAFWVGPPGENSNMPPDVQAILNNYSDYMNSLAG